MPRPITLFTGQWADMPLGQLAPLVRRMGYDGLELACWGDHFDVERAANSPDYCRERWTLLRDYGLECFAVSNHLVGQAVCDPIDERHRTILPPEVWGDGEPEGVRQRAAARLRLTARAVRAFFDADPSGRARKYPAVVNGFTGSSIWHSLYGFPPTSVEYWQKGFEDFARRFGPILEEFEAHNVNFALEVHPTEIAFDSETAARAVEAVKGHRRFGFNYDPSHLAYQGVDYVAFIRRFGRRIHHVHVKDAWWGRGDGTVGVFGGHTSFGDPRRHWDFRSPGRGDIRFQDVIVALSDVGYAGPLSVEWEDARMERVHGAGEACLFVRKLHFPRTARAFDAAFERTQS